MTFVISRSEEPSAIRNNTSACRTVLFGGVPGGVIAATGQNPVRNATLMRELRKLWAPRVLGYRVGVPTPSPLLRIGARLIRTDPALALTGRHVTSEVLADRYTFEFPTLEGALWDIRNA